MKTFKLIGVAILTVLLSVGFSSCSKSDDDNGGSSSNPLVGTWELSDEDGYYSTVELKADGSYCQIEYHRTTDNIQRIDKGTYKILSVNGNTYEVSIYIKERQESSGEIVTVNKEQTGFLTLSNNNNTMTSENGNIWKRKK
jgi:hypothetical protein